MMQSGNVAACAALDLRYTRLANDIREETAHYMRAAASGISTSVSVRTGAHESGWRSARSVRRSRQVSSGAGSWLALQTSTSNRDQARRWSTSRASIVESEFTAAITPYNRPCIACATGRGQGRGEVGIGQADVTLVCFEASSRSIRTAYSVIAKGRGTGCSRTARDG